MIDVRQQYRKQGEKSCLLTKPLPACGEGFGVGLDWPPTQFRRGRILPARRWMCQMSLLGEGDEKHIVILANTI